MGEGVTLEPGIRCVVVLLSFLFCFTCLQRTSDRHELTELSLYDFWQKEAALAEVRRVVMLHLIVMSLLFGIPSCCASCARGHAVQCSAVQSFAVASLVAAILSQ